MSTGWNCKSPMVAIPTIINLLGNEYWLEPANSVVAGKLAL